MSRRILTLALFGLFGSLTLSGTAEACHRCGGGKHRGQTYTYNGAGGVWSGANCGSCPGGSARPISYAPPVAYAPAHVPFYAPQPAYSAPQVMGNPAPAFAPAPAAPAKSAPQR